MARTDRPGADSRTRNHRETDKATTTDQCTALQMGIEVLQEQIAVLEEGLPGAPGMERAALAKEIAAYRGQLDHKLEALRRCRQTNV